MIKPRYFLLALLVGLAIYTVRQEHHHSFSSYSDNPIDESTVKEVEPSADPIGQHVDSTIQKSQSKSRALTQSTSVAVDNKKPSEWSPSSTPPKNPTSDAEESVSSEQARELARHTWGGGGFQPPNTPGFDDLFRVQRKKTGFTYSELNLKDGIYLVDFAENEKAKQLIFTASLKQVTQNDRTGFVAEWIMSRDSSKVSLTEFTSAYSEREIYYGFLHLPPKIFADVGYPFQDCPEILVVRHFDFDFDSTHSSFVTFFNARAYCRTDVDQLRFIGKMGFQYLRP